MYVISNLIFFFFFQAEDGIRDIGVTGVQTCALPISAGSATAATRRIWSLSRRQRTRVVALRQQRHAATAIPTWMTTSIGIAASGTAGHAAGTTTGTAPVAVPGQGEQHEHQPGWLTSCRGRQRPGRPPVRPYPRPQALPPRQRHRWHVEDSHPARLRGRPADLPRAPDLRR